jgi:hypothetical protein
MVGDDEEGATTWWRGKTNKFHTGFLGGSARLAAITGNTGTDYIFPGMLTTAIAGDDMVQGELPALLTAVLAGVSVTVENLKAGQLSFATGTLDQSCQPDYRWQRHCFPD